MATEQIVVPGIVTGGVVVPHGGSPLPEGARVEIVLTGPTITPELQAEFDAWDSVGDEAWARIDRLEQSEP